jgi:type IV pilus assembly protein PilP
LQLHRMIGMAGLGLLWTVWAGCGQEGQSPKPAAPVVKKIQKSDERPVTPPGPPAKETGKVSGTAPPQDTEAAKVQTEPKVQAEAQKKEDETRAEIQAPPATAVEQGVAEPKPGAWPDPFRPFFADATVQGGGASECDEIPPGPLTEQEVSQFALVGVVGQGREVLAMVQDRGGKGYVIRLGAYMGKKCGKVTEIGPDGLVIEEPYRDLLGQRKTREVTIGFKKLEGGTR